MSNLAFENTRFETIDGKMIMMSPSPTTNHNRVSGNIYHTFRSYLKGKHCEAFSDGVDVYLDEKNVVIPDAMIICNKDIIKADGVYGAPDLIAEVLSPSTASRDRKEKKNLYEKHGVKEYWIVNPTDKSIEVYLLQNGRYELDNVYSIYPGWQWKKMTDEEKKEAALTFRVSLYDDFEIDIQDIFENID